MGRRAKHLFLLTVSIIIAASLILYGGLYEWFQGITLKPLFLNAEEITNPRMKPFVAYADGIKQVTVTRKEREQHGSSVPLALREKMFKNEDLSLFPLARKRNQPLGVTTDDYQNVAWQSDIQKPTAEGTIHYKFKNSGTGKLVKIFCLPLPLLRAQAAKARIKDTFDPEEKDITLAYKKPKTLPGPYAFGAKEEYPHMFSLTTRTFSYGPIIYRCYVTGENPDINNALK